MTDDREDKTLEHKEQFTEVSNSRDVEVRVRSPTISKVFYETIFHNYLRQPLSQ